MATVTLQNISKTYPGGAQAVDDLSVEIAEGEFVVLVGPSGCGKSTTLRMIAGLEEATGGDLLIGDRRVNDVPPAKRDIAMVFQNYALYPHMTIRRNMAFGLKMRRMPKAEIDARVVEAAELLGLGDLLERRPGELSGGQKQRVALGRAIVRQPAVFLFDEPLSNLDAQLRAEMRAEIAALHKRLGATMIYVTHDQVEAMTLGDRLILMKDGVVQQVGSPLDVYRRPANRFVATFIGSPAMNLLEGAVAGGAFTLPGVDATLPVANAAEGPAVLGIRPEDVRPASDGDSPTVAASVRRVEQLGHETLLHVSLGQQPAIVRVAGRYEAPADHLHLTIAAGAVHLFAADADGRRLN